MTSINTLIALIDQHEKQFNESFSLIPSENPISPLARKMFLFDSYARYSFDPVNQWGTWAFPGGNIIGNIERDILIPLLKELTSSEYVNVKPISGLNGMLITILAYCDPGDCICVMPFGLGGHPSTVSISNLFGLKIIYAPHKKGTYDIDWPLFDLMLSKHKPKLVYVDQATVLFPLDISKIRKVIADNSLTTKIHVDSSHLNGLIFGKVIPNPLASGADSFGGTTHKTFAGPHKAFLATNDEIIAKRFSQKSENLTSHHHMADVIALTVAVIEFKEKKGEEYARQIVLNAKAFAKALAFLKFDVQAKEFGYTECHQVWLDVSKYMDAIEATKLLLSAGIILNTFAQLPLLAKPGFRMGVNEVTNYGLKEQEMEQLAVFFEDILVKKINIHVVAKEIKLMKQRFTTQKYCFTEDEVTNLLWKREPWCTLSEFSMKLSKAGNIR